MGRTHEKIGCLGISTTGFIGKSRFKYTPHLSYITLNYKYKEEKKRNEIPSQKLAAEIIGVSNFGGRVNGLYIRSGFYL